MPVAELDGIEIAYELVGEGQPWVLTPGRAVHQGGRWAPRDGPRRWPTTAGRC